MLFDTDVLIHVQRGNQRAIDLLVSIPKRYVSIITYMELIQGALDKKDLKNIKDFFIHGGFEILNLNKQIGHRASFYVEMYTLSHSMVLADALIASTAIDNGLVLSTANTKHFKCIKDLNIKTFKA